MTAVAERLGWVSVIAEEDMPVDMGVPALVGDSAVAVFRLGCGATYAVSNIDPRTGSSVIARGIVGSRGDVPTVASPIYKEVFNLRTGVCLDDPTKVLTAYQVRVADGMVQVRGMDGGSR